MTADGQDRDLRLRLLWVALAAALPLVIFAAVMIGIVSRLQQETITNGLQQTTAASVRSVDERISASLSALEILGTSRALEEGQGAALADRISRALARRPDWIALEVHERGGATRIYPADGTAAAAPVAGADASSIEAVIRYGEPHIGSILFAAGPGSEPVIPLSVPVFGDQGVSHVLTAYLRAWTINRTLRDQGLPTGWVIAVIDDGQRMLARTLSDSPEDPLLGTPPDPSVIEGISRGSSFFYSRTRTGEQVYTTAATSALTGWTVLLGTPAADMEAATRKSTLAVVGGGTTALAMALALGWLLIQSYARRETAERRMVALEAASAAERRSAAILESTTDGVFELDRDWRITFMNGRARHLLTGGTDDTGRIIWDVFPESISAEVRDRYRQAMDLQEPVEFEEFYPPVDAWHAVRLFPSPKGLAVYFQDVTERKRLGETLKHEQALLERVLETLPVGVFVIGADGGIVRTNAAAARIWEGERKVGIERYGEYKGWWVETGQPIKPKEWAAARAVFQGETSLGEVIDIECFDGSRKTIRNSTVPIRGDRGELAGAVAVIEDITGERIAQQALADSEVRYRAVVETAVDALVIIDESGIVQSFNRAAERIFGYAADEVIGRNVSLLMPERHRSGHDGYLSNYLLTGERKIIGIGREVDGLHRDGTPIPLELSIAEWWTGGRRFFTGIMRDVSRRREMERRLRQNLALLDTIIESCPDPIFVKDRDGRYLVANSAAGFVHGKLRSHLIGVPEQDLITFEGGITLVENDRRIMAAGHSETVEESVFSKGHNELRHYLATKVPLRDDTGEVIGIIGIARDITVRKAMEDELRQAKEGAEQANLAKSKFLAAASHDLRQPMQSLFLFSAALAPHVANDRGQKTLTLLERGLDTLKALLDSLLDVSRLDAGVINPEVGTVLLGEVIGDIEAAFTPVARAKGLRLRVEPSCAVTVRSDPMLLGRMIRNLVENALRYTEHGEVLIGCTVADAIARVEVADTGIGIPSDHLERIFEEFHQVGNIERDRSQGLGLGLAIVRRLSQLLDHPVWVRSEIGRGSVFAVDLPLGLSEAVTATQPCAPTPLAKSGLCALVVDDDVMVLTGLQVVLEGWGYEVLIAGSGDEALERLQEAGRTPDVVIVDYRLREGEIGTNVVRRVRDFIGHPVPGVLLTGETGSEFQHEAAANDLGLAHKPVTPRQLYGVLERQLRAAE